MKRGPGREENGSDSAPAGPPRPPPQTVSPGWRTPRACRPGRARAVPRGAGRRRGRPLGRRLFWLDPPALKNSEVGKLDLRLGQRRRPAFAEGPIQRRELAEKDIE